MAAYKSNVPLQPDAQGNYRRDVGPRSSSRRIYLGKDLTQARLRRVKLEAFWELVETHHEPANNGGRIYSSGKAKPTSNTDKWTPFLHEVAKAIGRGETAFRVEKPDGFRSLGPSYYRHVASLNEKYGAVMQFVPADEHRAAEGRETLVSAFNTEASLESAQLNEKWHPSQLRIGLADLENFDPTMFHQALDEYAEAIKADPVNQDVETKELSKWGERQLKTVTRFKDRHSDMPISQINITTIRSLCDYWRARPLTVFKKIKAKKRKNTPIACSTARHHIWQLKDFFNWLGDSPKHRWTTPPELRRISLVAKRTDEEMQKIVTAEQVSSWTVDELAVIYQTMTDLERCYFLLGMNCGFGPGEFRTLKLNQVFLRQKNPFDKFTHYKSNPSQSWIRRVRGKSGVYGEWLLWPETVRAIEWAMKRRQGVAISTAKTSNVFVTENGRNYSSQRIANQWNEKVLPRILKNDAEFRTLPPKSLRKTSGNMIRDISGSGEIMGIFHSRGLVVKTDELAEVYSNRPWRHVFDAIEKLHARLKPVWKAVPDAFERGRT